PDRLTAYRELQRPAAVGQPLARPPIEIGDDVAESIDPYDGSAERAILHEKLRQLQMMKVRNLTPERGDLDAFGEPSGSRSETIAPSERPAHRGSRVPPLGQLDDLLGWSLREHRTQHAVIRRDELPVAGFGGDTASLRADAGIHDGEEDGACGK